MISHIHQLCRKYFDNRLRIHSVRGISQIVETLGRSVRLIPGLLMNECDDCPVNWPDWCEFGVITKQAISKPRTQLRLGWEMGFHSESAWGNLGRQTRLRQEQEEAVVAHYCVMTYWEIRSLSIQSMPTAEVLSPPNFCDNYGNQQKCREILSGCYSIQNVKISNRT